MNEKRHKKIDLFLGFFFSSSSSSSSSPIAHRTTQSIVIFAFSLREYRCIARKKRADNDNDDCPAVFCQGMLAHPSIFALL
jgi:hypothetical protein